jgi:curved DNA-binding protein
LEFIDYYNILGLTKEASQADVKKAYRKMARKYHPDVNPNNKDAEARFKQINEANEVLGDVEKRKKYDQYGKDWQHAEEFQKRQQSGHSQRPAGGPSGDFGGQDFSDFFESMFGGGARGFGGGRQVKFRGQDLNAEVRLLLQDAYHTHKQTFTINGKNIRITIPAGVENGQTIKIPGHGGPGRNGGPNGDLFITFSVENTTPFKRDGDHLYRTVPLDLYSAILGGEITIDTFDGKVKLKIKPETQSGTMVKLKNKGFPVYKKEGEFGDLFITFSVVMPTHLTPKEQELFKELAALRTQKTS